MLKREDCKDIKLLYVEDDQTAASAMIRIFEKFFTNIIVAKDGEEGLSKIKEHDIDLIVTDINMPKMNGIEMISGMKEFGKDIYTIMLTAYSDNNTFLDSVKLGVKGYAIKPIDVMQFVETLESAVDIINAQKQNSQLEHYNNLIVSKTDINGKITFVNDMFCEITGYTKDELLGKTHSVLKSNDMSEEFYKNLWNTIINRNIWLGQIKNKRKDGTLYRLDTTICPIVNSHGDIIEYMSIRNDTSHILTPEVEIQDLLTVTEKPFLIMLKIANYRTLEYIYSDDIINDMIDTFKMLLYTYLPDGFNVDKIVSFNNGEFMLLKSMDDSSMLTLKEQEELMHKLQYNIEQSIVVVDDYDFDLSVIISYSTSKNEILKNVEYGIEMVNKENKTIICSDNLMQITKEIAVKNTTTIKMIQTAITTNNIVSYFQAITNNKTKKIEKYESLVRLITPEGKVLSPYFFLDVAKESGYYRKITSIVLNNSFEALYKTDKEISINLSAVDIENVFTRDMIINLLKKHSNNANRVVFELLEDEQVRDFETVKNFITEVKTYGVKIAIDDFGAGVSNFERLLDYQPDVLKIDACLIKNIDKDKYSKDVVETIQLFAWKQDIKTVAEFVETEEILKTVTDIGINYTQGYLLGKPDVLENIF